jgi:excisionase family DNA binding protein
LPEDSVDDRWLSVDEIAEYLGVSRDTVYNWMRDRGMPRARIGRFWRFKKDSVDAWVATGQAAIEPALDERGKV